MRERWPESTLADVRSSARSRPVALLRAAAVVALAGVVLAGLLGAFGIRTATRTVEAEGYTLSVTYPRTARAGLDVTWQVRVSHPGGFGDEITLAVTADYFEIFETQGWSPAPTDETNDGERNLLTFTAPPGEDFTFTYDAYVQPASQRGRGGEVSLVVDDRVVATVDFDTWLAP